MPLRRLLQLFAEMTVLVSLEYFFLIVVRWRFVVSSPGFAKCCGQRAASKMRRAGEGCFGGKEHGFRRYHAVLGVSKAVLSGVALWTRVAGMAQGRSSMKGGGGGGVVCWGRLPRSGPGRHKVGKWMQIAPWAGIRRGCLKFSRVGSRLHGACGGLWSPFGSFLSPMDEIALVRIERRRLNF
jgi:hypothetical protein